VRIRGHVSQAVSGGRTNINVMITPRGGDSMLMMQMNRGRMVDPKGNFEITGVAPGAYYLRASLYNGEKSYNARVPVDVTSSNIDGIEVAIGPGVDLTGVITIEGDAAQKPGDLQIRLFPSEPGTMIFGPGGNDKVNPDGSFKLENLSPDNYRLTVIGLPDGFYVKSVRVGQNETLPGPFEVTVAPETVSVMLSPKAGQVTGAVQNPKTQQAAPGAVVVLIPQEKDRREQITYFKQTTTDQFGNFSLKNLPPGEYKVFAWEDVEPGAYSDPEFLKPLEGNGKNVTVQESGRQSVQLKLIPADAQTERRQ
jgi:carboxypeptidase family protein